MGLAIINYMKEMGTVVEHVVGVGKVYSPKNPYDVEKATRLKEYLTKYNRIPVVGLTPVKTEDVDHIKK